MTVFIRNKAIGAALLVLTVVLAAARVAAQVHHVPDVLAGAGAGIAAALAGGWVAERLGSAVDKRWPALSGRAIS